MVNNKMGISPLVPGENGIIGTMEYEMKDKSVADIDIKVNPEPTEDYQKAMYDTIRNFEIDAWSPKSDGLKTGFTTIDKAFDGGLKNGFIIIAADSNVGKTAFMSQMAWQVVENNKDVYVMDFSLDDPMEDKIPRIVASNSRVVINSVKNPQKYMNNPNMLKRRTMGLARLYNRTDKYLIRDASFTTDIETIEEEIIRMKVEFERLGVDKRIVVFIDNFHDLTTKEHPNYQDKQKYDHIAQKCADIAIKYKIPLVCTAEFRKMNGSFRPTLDSIRESVKIKYEAKAILLCHNEVHYKGEGADVYFEREDKPDQKQPVFEIHFAKNKISSFKGRLFFESYPEMAYMTECDDNTTKSYASQIS